MTVGRAGATTFCRFGKPRASDGDGMIPSPCQERRRTPLCSGDIPFLRHNFLPHGLVFLTGNHGGMARGRGGQVPRWVGRVA